MSGEEDPAPTDDPPAVLTGAAAAVATEAVATETAITSEYATTCEILCWGRYRALAHTFRTVRKRVGHCTKPRDKGITTMIGGRAVQGGDAAGPSALH